MPCYSPLKIQMTGLDLDSGNKRFAISKFKPGDNLEGFQIVPCGSCIGCRIDYARQWADRCMLEAKDHEENYFLTLTYDDLHLDTVMRKYKDRASGKEFDAMSLCKRDLQLFHKSLRKALDDRGDPKIRFFACGEYGSPENTMRPHYHEICFGLHLDDKIFYKYNKQGDCLYTSEFLNKIWKKGYVIIGDVTFQSASYVARYVTKKLKGDAAELYEVCNMTPPFTVMSRRPGIGRKYYDEHPELFDYSYLPFSTDDGCHKIYPPKYFKSLLKVDDEERWQELNDKNILSAELKSEAKLKNTELDLYDQLQLEKSSFENRIRILDRKEC